MVKRIVVVVITLLFLSILLPIHHATSQPSTTISIQPQGVFGQLPNDTFTVNITVSNVNDLYAWGVYLYYQSSILNGTSVVEGDFLGTPNTGQTYFIVTDFTDNYNATFGYLYVSGTRVGNVPGVSGSGTLATVTFTAVGYGDAVLHLANTALYDSAEPIGNAIPHIDVDGEVYVGQVDVAITEIDVPSNIAQGSIAAINVTAQNRGTPPETFDVTLTDNGNPIGTQSIMNLVGGGSKILTFYWDTTSASIGQVYTLTATATPPPAGQSDMSDLTLSVNVYIGTRNIAVTGITSKTSIAGGISAQTSVQVSVQNMGQATEAFNVTLSANSQLIGTQLAALSPGGTGTVTFLWNTTTLGYGNYTLQAYIPPLPYQAATTDNNRTLQTVVTIPGDINGDFKVSLADLVLLANAYGSVPTYLKWNPNADVDGNGIVGLSDLVTLALHYGQHYP